MNNHDALTYEVPLSIHPQVVINAIAPAVLFHVEGFPKIVADWAIGEKWGSMRELVLDSKYQIVRASKLKVEEDDPFEEMEGEEEGETFQKDIKLDLSLLESRAKKAESVQVAQVPQATPQIYVEQSDGPAINFVVELHSMPDQEQVSRFVDLLTRHKGKNTVILRTPQGDIPWESWPTSLSNVNAPEFSILFGAATVYLEQVDASAVLEGISL
jgi:hypothetical protein